MARARRSRLSHVASLASPAALTLVFLGQLSSLVHMGVVQHARCAEHGELVDVDAHAAARPTEHDIALLASASPGADSDSHDHCPLATTPSTNDALPALAIDDVPTGHHAALTAPPASTQLAVDVLAVAPKTSPPVRA